MDGYARESQGYGYRPLSVIQANSERDELGEFGRICLKGLPSCNLLNRFSVYLLLKWDCGLWVRNSVSESFWSPLGDDGEEVEEALVKGKRMGEAGEAFLEGYSGLSNVIAAKTQMERI